jgi:hypothetical protein
VTRELRLFSDYHQIHILDSGSEVVPEDYWGRADTSVRDHLALAEDAVGINTGVNDYVTVSIDKTAGPPAEDKAAFDTVTECSLRAGSGELVVTSPTWGWEDADRVSVPPGWLRLRISLTRSPFDEFDEDDPDHRQHIRIQCWPAPLTGPVLIKGWDSVAERHV